LNEIFDRLFLVTTIFTSPKHKQSLSRLDWLDIET